MGGPEKNNVLQLDDSLCSQLYDEIFKIDEEERPRTPALGPIAFKDSRDLRALLKVRNQSVEEIDECKGEDEGTLFDNQNATLERKESEPDAGNFEEGELEIHLKLGVTHSRGKFA